MKPFWPCGGVMNKGKIGATRNTDDGCGREVWSHMGVQVKVGRNKKMIFCGNQCAKKIKGG